MHFAFAQSKVKSAEYFWDTDPGEGHGHAVSTGSAADSVMFKATIPITGLSQGFHALYMRVYSDSLKWSLTEQNNIYVYQNFTPTPPNINAAEYFWDTDPGEGKGKPVTINTPSDSVHLTATIPLGSLSTGFHGLYIRFRSANGNWGIIEQQEVYVYTNFNPVAPSITQAEYFWDTDPGEGSGAGVTVSPSNDSVHLLASIPVSGTATGFHSLYFRTKSVNGNWGIVEQQEVYVYTNFNPVLPNITAAEYFWDADPGEGKGKSVSVTKPADSVQVSSVIPVGDSTGFHQLYFRTKDAQNRWSLVEHSMVYVTNYGAKQDSIINAAEYFIDTDPGEGKATKIIVNNPGDTIKQAFVIHIPTNIDTGYHLVFVRTRTSHGLWGVSESAQIYVGKTLPISLLYFRAALNNGKTDLDWETTTEVNSSQYLVQRSLNSKDFTTIATLQAAGNSSTPKYYSTTDDNPPYGIVYYRLKEVDKDGNVTYSLIVQVDNNNIASAVRLYPNPAKYVLHIDIPGSVQAKAITIYNNLGQAVIQKIVSENESSIQLDVSTLAQGNYHVVIFSKNGNSASISFTR